MATHKLLILPGDGIGPEVMAEVEKVVAWFGRQGVASFETERGLVGGSAYDAHGEAISNGDMALAQAADAVMFGAVGGPKWADVPYSKRPEAGLLRLRKDLGLFANLRPAICFAALAAASSLKPEVVEGLDILIVRELTGGVYFGEPKEIVTLEDGQQRAVDTQLYTTSEIERIFSRSASVRIGWRTSSRLVPAMPCRSNRFGRGPMIETRLMTSSSRIGSIGGLVTCAKFCLK